MTPDITYLIRIQDHINKSDRVIHKVTTLDNSVQDFNIIINHLNKDNIFSVTLRSGEAQLNKTETITVPGYIYNSTKCVTTLAYTLSLIKIDTTLSELFHTEFTNSETQTNVIDNSDDIQTKETQSEQETEDKPSQTSDIKTCEVQTEPELESTDDSEFGEFQSCSPEFINVDLNNSCNYPYDSCNYNSYNSYNPYTYNSYSYNPFHNIMNLRGENEDVHFRFGTNQGSQVPINPTQITPPTPTWSPELVNELKFRLAQPNAGLQPTNNISYYL